MRSSPACPRASWKKADHRARGPRRRCSTLDEDARALDWHQLRTLADEGWEIGAHTIDHVALVHEPPIELTDQLLVPKLELEE